jgi:hypothetical protein
MSSLSEEQKHNLCYAVTGVALVAIAYLLFTGCKCPEKYSFAYLNTPNLMNKQATKGKVSAFYGSPVDQTVLEDSNIMSTVI